MKKVIFLIVFAIFPVFSFFAEDSVVHAVNLSFPLGHNTWHVEYPADGYSGAKTSVPVTYFGAGLNWNRMTVNDSRYSFIFGLTIGFSAAMPKDFIFGDDLSLIGRNYGVKLGWGGTLVRNEKMILALHGITMFDMRVLFASESEENAFSFDGSDEIVIRQNYDYTVVDFGNAVGMDVVFVWRVRPTFALMGSLDITTNFFGFGFCSIDSADGGGDSFGISYGFIGITVTPRLGVCWVL